MVLSYPTSVIKVPYAKKSITLPEETATDLDKVARDLSIPVSCVIQIALSRPDKYALLVGGDKAVVKPLGKNIVDNLTKALEDEKQKLEEHEGTEDEKGLGDQILAWINEP